MPQEPIEPIQPVGPSKGIDPSSFLPTNGESTQAQGAAMAKIVMNAFITALKEDIARERQHAAERKNEERKAIEGG